MGNMDAGRIRQFVGGSNVKAGGWNAPLPRFVDLRSVTGGIPSSWSVYPLAPPATVRRLAPPSHSPPTHLGGALSHLVVAPRPRSAFLVTSRSQGMMLWNSARGPTLLPSPPIPRPILRALSTATPWPKGDATDGGKKRLPLQWPDGIRRFRLMVRRDPVGIRLITLSNAFLRTIEAAAPSFRIEPSTATAASPCRARAHRGIITLTW